MWKFFASFLPVALVPLAAYAVEPDPQAVLDFVLPYHWQHTRPLVAVEGEVAIDNNLSPWRVKPSEAWLRRHVAAYATDFVAQFSEVRTEFGRLDTRWPSRITQMDLSIYRDGRVYDWSILRRDHPSIDAVVEVTEPVFSLDGRVAIVGYFSVEPLGTHKYFSVVRLNSAGAWEWGFLATTHLQEGAPQLRIKPNPCPQFQARIRAVQVAFHVAISSRPG